MVIQGNNLVINGTTVEATDLTNVANITSDVQTQLNSKENTIGFIPINKAGDTASGKINLFSHNVSAGTQRRIRTYEYVYSHPQNTRVDLMYNNSAYTDVHFTLTLEAFHSGRSYQMWQGCFGGYGGNFITTGGSGGFALQNNGLDTGRAYLSLYTGALTNGVAEVYISMTIYGDTGITLVNGGLY